MESIIVEFYNELTGKSCDLEIPTFIKVTDLLRALNEAYELNIDFSKPQQLFLRAENPVALLVGDHLISDFKLHNGTRLIYSR